MYYRLNEDGTVMDWSNGLKPYAPDCLFTDKQVVAAWNGSNYIEGMEPAMPAEMAQAQDLIEAKAERAYAVSNITVEVDGMLFDGNEDSQSRMGRTIAAAVALGLDLTTEKRTWVLADNTIVDVTIAQLAQVLKLAGDAQTALWVVPYTGNET